MTVSENFDLIRKNMNKVERTYERPEGSTALIAVTKTQPADFIQAALDGGHRLFGENKVQEAQQHWAEYREKNSYPDLRLHLIGPLQTNKVSDAVRLFDCIQTVDREKLAAALGQETVRQGRALDCFIQVNTGEEEQKSGIVPGLLPDFLHFCREECGLQIAGLMCIPPLEDPAALHFALLKKLAGIHGLPGLSMGMSGDYKKAIALGATHVRVGTALFGARPSIQ